MNTSHPERMAVKTASGRQMPTVGLRRRRVHAGGRPAASLSGAISIARLASGKCDQLCTMSTVSHWPLTESYKVQMPVSSFLLLVLLVACGTRSPEPAPVPCDLATFSFLRIGMSFAEITERVGMPDEDIGSGVYLFQYNLTDGCKVVLQFITRDHLSKVWIVDREGEWTLWLPEDGPE